MTTIPLIDVAAIFEPDCAARAKADAAILAAASDNGFLVLTGLPSSLSLGAEARGELLRLFELPEKEKHRLWRKASAPENPNVYRGYFPLSSGVIKEGMDVGAPNPVLGERGDALTEPTPLPSERALPGWRDRVDETFTGLGWVATMLMRAIARELGLPEAAFDAAFVGGISTLRMIRYPAWPAPAEHYGLPLRQVAPGRYAMGGEHVELGLRDAAAAGRRRGPAGACSRWRLDHGSPSGTQLGRQLRPALRTLDGRKDPRHSAPRARQ